MHSGNRHESEECWCERTSVSFGGANSSPRYDVSVWFSPHTRTLLVVTGVMCEGLVERSLTPSVSWKWSMPWVSNGAPRTSMLQLTRSKWSERLKWKSVSVTRPRLMAAEEAAEVG